MAAFSYSLPFTLTLRIYVDVSAFYPIGSELRSVLGRQRTEHHLAIPRLCLRRQMEANGKNAANSSSDTDNIDILHSSSPDIQQLAR